LSTNDDKICIKLYSLLREIIKDISSEGLLLSGGVDSSIIASIQKPKYAFTVSLEGKGSDLIYASQIAEKYGSKHIQVKIAYEELTKIEEKIIQLFETFDPIFVRNSSVIFAGIQKASQLGISTILTGDGGDELFAGYNYLKRYYNDPKKLDMELKRLWEIMHFPSKKIGHYFKINVETPFLNETFIDFAKSLDVCFKVNEYNGKVWGKYILRKCLDKYTSMKTHSWREKEAQEEGSGFSLIGEYFNQVFNDEEFASESKRIKEKDNVKIRSKEHLFYYNTFRKYYAAPKESNCNRRCPECNGCFEWSGKFCRLCGAFPVDSVLQKSTL